MTSSVSTPVTTPPSVWALAWRGLLRDLQAGELRLLILAVTLAVGALTAVGFFADRLKSGLTRDASQLLGGDLVVVSDAPPLPAVVQAAQAKGLRTAVSLSFPTMARAPDERGGAARLVALKAVNPGYPLRGKLSVRTAPTEPTQTATGIPAAGEVWVDAALLDALGLAVGDVLLLGDARLRIARLIANEPDRGAGFMNFAPRVMLAESDLSATGLVQPASRITWRLAVADPSSARAQSPAVQRFTAWMEEATKRIPLRGTRVESLEGGRPEMRQTLDRAEKFLSLVALLAALLSAVAVALSARAFANAHLDDCAMLRVLGQSQRSIARSYSLEFALAGVGASVLGVVLGYAVHFVFVALLAGLVDGSLPPPGLWPAGLGLGMGLTLLVAFGLPPVLQLAQVPPLRVIRRDLGGIKPASVGVLLLGVAGFAGLLLVVSSDIVLGAIAVGGFAAAALIFAGLAFLAIRGLRAWVREERAPQWLILATRQIAARPAYAVVQVSALAVGLLALILLVLLRTDLVTSWRNASPPDAPNRFVINVMPEQADAFRQTLEQAGIRRYDWFPMIRGRLVSINGRAVSPDDYREDRAKRLVDREFNLSHAPQSPQHNSVIAGTWTPEEAGAVSVEEGIAKSLGLKLGDRLRFDIGGVSVESRITSLRRVDWQSMRANFFVMYPVSRMPDVPATYMGAFRAPERKGFDNELTRQFPNVTNVDMSSTVTQIQNVLGQVIRAIEFLFGFTLAAGLVVLFAAVTATREERAREYAILRAMGARGSLLRRVQRAELAGVGLLAGVLAGVVASGVGWALARFAFEFNWVISPWVPLGGALAGAALALAAGWWGLREVLRRPVVQTLRQAAE